MNKTLKTLKELQSDLDSVELFKVQVVVMQSPENKAAALKIYDEHKEWILAEMKRLINQKEESFIQKLVKKIGLRK